MGLDLHRSALATFDLRPVVASAGPVPAPIEKPGWRSAADALWRARPPAQRRAHAMALAAAGVQLAQALGARRIGLYSPLGAEVETRDLAFALLGAGLRLAYPRLKPDGSAMDFADCGGPGELHPRPRSRLLEPAGPGVEPDAIDLVVVPCVLVRPDGVRLGRGGGHYDRWLPRLPERALKVGVAGATCIVPWGPAAPHDVRMDLICTEAGLLLPS